ncbi:MAG: DUF3857 domain-containing transglutaminase family protein [Erythrobacter sp.]|uniref:DUF3857 domain-containing transglutaminase family protein n=1 Tax=Erythrobacter sp. TaxID=1042 RepID=UPI002635F2C2|nr:DUF3857 domain-containing transglutaminase family protein [Erythrobacter sp.]MDJ0977007.1 DUF3857 domain-containing transglutaminase family protein [Erythrobacter sp.]
MSLRPSIAAALALSVAAPIAFASTLNAQPSEAQDASSVPIAPTPEWASDSEPLPVPEDAQGLIFVRRQDTIARLTETGARSYQSQLFRLLQPQALQLGNIAFAWNPASGPAQVHAVRIHRGSRVIDVLESTQFEILRREDQLEQAMLDGNLTASLRVPDLRVGDDLEFAYTVPLHDPTLKEASHGLLFLADAPPSGRFRLELSWEVGQEPAIQLTDDLKEVAERTDNAITVRFDNPEAIAPPRNAPPRYSWARIIEYSDFATWEAVSRRFFDLFDVATQLDANSPLREEAAFIASENASKLAQAQAALKLVQQQVRYVYVGLNGGNFTPASADETWERRYGDCKGKTAMLLALLRELEIEAEAVLVANTIPTDGHPNRLANPGLFDHVLVRARIDGEDYWLDGTLPAVIEARDEPFFRYQSVLPLASNGKALERLPERPFELPQQMGIVDIDARAGFDEPAKKTEIIVSRGPSALQEYYSFSAVTDNQLEAAFRSELVGNREWDSIDKVAYRFDKETQASVLEIVGTGPVDWEAEEDGTYTFRLPGGGFNPPDRRQRAEGDLSETPYWQSPQYSCFATTVRLPEETELEKWSFNTVFDTMLFGRVFYRAMEKRNDRTIRMVRASRTETTEITPKRAARDNERLANFDNSMAVIGYYPREETDTWNGTGPVPATDEVDWTGQNPPCLPADMLKK